MSRAVETIAWVPVSERLPDADATVLLFADEQGAFEGFLDGMDAAGAPRWRDVTAWPVPAVTHWAAMPEGPSA
jgi:hypothetical protein